MSLPTPGYGRHSGPDRRRYLLLPLLASILMVAVLAPPAQAQSTDDAAVDPFLRGQAAVDRLAAEMPALAQASGVSRASLQELFLSDPTLALSPDNELAYFDPLAPDSNAGAGADAAAPDTPAAAPPVTGPEFQLATDPGALKTIYIDFDGHTTVGTSWNSSTGVATIVSPPYDTNGLPDAWSANELLVIRSAWAVAAEDFAPWNVNVTTIDPGPEALRYSGAGDTRWGVRLVVTDDNFLNCNCGGAAFLGSFDDPTDEPAFVFNSDRVGVSEAASHEVGHTLLLTHDGTTAGAEYYLGHNGGGVPGWAPIMGAAYYQSVSQWSQQEYRNANNNTASANLGNGPDDIAIISSLTNGNGFGFRPDDHGNTAATATPLTSGAVSAAGLIGTRADVDVFSFTTSGGQVNLTANPAIDVRDLDIAVTLRAGNGTVVASQDQTNGLAAGVVTTVPAGTYTFTVDGGGAGSPGADPPTGYSDYASLGRFTLSGTIQGIGAAPVIRGSVRASNGTPAPGVDVGLFQASGYDRVAWLQDGRSGADGSLAFSGLAPGCYLLTFVAPAGQLFTNGTGYLNSEPTCVTFGDDVSVAPVTLVGASTTGSIAGSISEAGGTAIWDVAIGVFQANGDGSRGAWGRDTASVGGTFTVNLSPGCYVLTFVAPAGRIFTNGTSYTTTDAICLTAGQAVTGVNATLLALGMGSSISGTVRTTAGTPMADLAIGVFQANTDGTRGRWLRDVRTGADGTYRTADLAPACYVLTFVAPPGQVFTNASPYLTTSSLCVNPSAPATGVDATVVGAGSTATIGGTVRANGGAAVGGVSIGVFQANGDGSRGPWLRDTTTAANGTYLFANLLPGCYVITFVAPAGRVFTNASPYLTTGALCLAAGNQTTGIDATLN